MPIIRSFTIKNFKGAHDITVELTGKLDKKVITLIGLNESGKTTILEAISHFITGDLTGKRVTTSPFVCGIVRRQSSPRC